MIIPAQLIGQIGKLQSYTNPGGQLVTFAYVSPAHPDNDEAFESIRVTAKGRQAENLARFKRGDAVQVTGILKGFRRQEIVAQCVSGVRGLL